MFSNFISVIVLLHISAATTFTQTREKCNDRCRKFNAVLTKLYLCEEDRHKITCSLDEKALIYRYCKAICLKTEFNDLKQLIDLLGSENMMSDEEVNRDTIIEGLLRKYLADEGTDEDGARRIKRDYTGKSFNTGGSVGGAIGGSFSFGPEGIIKEGAASGFASGFGNRDEVTIKDDGTRYENYIGANGGIAGAGSIYGDSIHPGYAVNYSHAAAGALNAQMTADKNGQQLYGLGGSLAGAYNTNGVGVLGTNPYTGLPMLSTVSNTIGGADAVGVAQLGNLMGGYVTGGAITEGVSRYNTGLVYGPNGFGLQGFGRDYFNTEGELNAHAGIGQRYPSIPW